MHVCNAYWQHMLTVLGIPRGSCPITVGKYVLEKKGVSIRLNLILSCYTLTALFKLCIHNHHGWLGQNIVPFVHAQNVFDILEFAAVWL